MPHTDRPHEPRFRSQTREPVSVHQPLGYGGGIATCPTALLSALKTLVEAAASPNIAFSPCGAGEVHIVRLLQLVTKESLLPDPIVLFVATSFPQV